MTGLFTEMPEKAVFKGTTKVSRIPFESLSSMLLMFSKVSFIVVSWQIVFILQFLIFFLQQQAFIDNISLYDILAKITTETNKIMLKYIFSPVERLPL